MNLISEEFIEIHSQIGASDVAVAILVLAQAIQRSSDGDKERAAMFSHELALALKHVLAHSVVNVAAEVAQHRE
jgi:hypothetical protein